MEWARTGTSLALEVGASAAITTHALGLQRLDYLGQLASAIA